MALSSNYALYADMSNRMMAILAQYSPDQEIYSIDECFLGLDGFSHLDLHAYTASVAICCWFAAAGTKLPYWPVVAHPANVSANSAAMMILRMVISPL